MVKHYKELVVWQKAMNLVMEVYQVTMVLPENEKFGLASQLRRAAVSIPSNIAEGQGRVTSGEFRQCLGHARDPLFEVEPQALLATRLQLVGEQDTLRLHGLIDEVGRLLNSLMRSLEPSNQRKPPATSHEEPPMLPAHLAENIRQQVLYYLQSTFDFRDKGVECAFERFLENPETGVFKGPWVHLRRPFRPAPPDVAMPFEIHVSFQPFLHQWRAWDRLSSKHHPSRPTIITTGTGSGKTECFLYPILDHCRRARQQGQKGIKAIVLYPMNALAADQEKRFARVIWDDPMLKAAGIRVGNYTGRYDPADPGASAESGTRAMGPDFGITNHAAQQEHPPDILLTNYKMLDFLLMRPQDQNLWRFNEPGVLRYLVLDELHTYHGAQGADVACLIRRLKERLAIPRGELCVIGTSATLDNRDQIKHGDNDTIIDAMETSKDRLARFAETLFEESIPPEAVIGEDRLRVEEIMHGDALDVALPDPHD